MLNATLIGNLGSDPELKYLDDGTAVLNFSVASNNARDEKKDPTWVRVAIFGKRAEGLSKIDDFKKGFRVGVVGSLELRTYTKNDEKRTSLEMRAQDVELLGVPGGGGKQDSGNGRPPPRDQQRRQQRNDDGGGCPF